MNNLKTDIIQIILISIFSPILLIAGDLVVDKNALSQYQTDNFLRFDIFDLNNDLVHYGGWNTADTIDLSNKAVTLGSAFTQEVWIFSDQRGWTTQEIIGYTP